MSAPSSSLAVSDLFSVSSLTVLITGGAKGIGAMITEGFITNGAKVIIVGRDQKALDEMSTRMSALPSLPSTSSLITIQSDLSSLAGIESLVSSLSHHKISSINVLINNSGIAWGEPIEKYQEKGWDNVMNLNVKSMFFLTKSLLPHLLSASSPSHPSRVINIGSVAGHMHQPQPTWAYDVSKAAVHHLSKKMAMDFGRREGKKILVNVIAPGFVPSKMSTSLKIPQEMLNAAIPLGRVGAKSDMVGVSLFLASKASNWVTGANIVVDGGQLTNTPKLSPKL